MNVRAHRNRIRVRSFVSLATAALVTWSGCSVGPDYRRPALVASGAAPDAFARADTTNAVGWKISEPGKGLPREGWWRFFDDAGLEWAERAATTNNQRIAGAMASLDQARAARRVVAADAWPQVNGTTSATRERTSASTSPTSATAGKSKTFDVFALGADASWELDLWGRVRREKENARANEEAARADLDALRLSVQAEVALDYFGLRSLESQRDVVARTLEGFSKALELTRNRRRAGVATELDEQQATTELRAAEAQLPALELQHAQLSDALAVLCGVPAPAFRLPARGPSMASDPVVPVSVPSEWLEGRPDIAAAERRMAAANASVGVARAAYYPRIVLAASGGFQSVDAATWLDWPSHVWAIGPSLQVPLFNAGKTRAQEASARAVFDANVASYRQAVLVAFQEVADQLAAMRLLDLQLAAEQEALVSARRASEIATTRYKAGVEQYLDVITAQESVLTHELTVIRLRGARHAATVSLAKAIGGGWHGAATSGNPR